MFASELVLILLCAFLGFTNLILADEVEDAQNFLQGEVTKAESLKNDINLEKISIYDWGNKNLSGSHYPAKGKVYALRNEFNDARTVERNKHVVMTNVEAQVKGTEELASLRLVPKLNEFRVEFERFVQFINDRKEEHNKNSTILDSAFSVSGGIYDWIAEKTEELETLTAGDEEIDRLKKELYIISRQAQLAQFNEEEKVRSDGNSGLKQIRSRFAGEKSYFTNTHNGRSIAAIHDHSNNIRTVGMGEFVAVLNGVEFRTRHNDYRLKKPSMTSTNLHVVEDIEFPPVPPDVEKDSSGNTRPVADQVEEMRKYLKAFQLQDTSIKDYRPYFRPILCYLEGAWMTNNGDGVDEPFESDRHKLDAKTWFELAEKIQFTSYVGTKSRFENLAHLPTTIMDFTAEQEAIFAQWNYRILCHPLKNDLPTRYLKLVNETSTQQRRGQSYEEYANSRAARFDLFGMELNSRGDIQRREYPIGYSLMDALMEEIPGKDNYPANIKDNGFDSSILSANPKTKGGPLNAGYYHRPYQLNSKDAMGVSTSQRGYSDVFYFALTTQSRVSGPSMTEKVDGVDQRVSIKGSYAIPLEIIYLTPLSTWNPYNLEHKEKEAEKIGAGTAASPLETTTEKFFYRTPQELFTGATTESDNADTASAGGLYIKTKTGETKVNFPSGTRIMFPEIAGVDGLIRQRYPIMPVYGEGSSIWKKINAIEDSLEKMIVIETGEVEYYATGVSSSTKPGDVFKRHSHIVEFDKKDLDALKVGSVNEIIVTTQVANAHEHRLVVRYNTESNNFYVHACDNSDAGGKVCFDEHYPTLETSPA